MPARTETILRLELPYRDELVLERTVYHGGKGPKAVITSGIHGDEIEGLYVCHHLARWLDAHPRALKGRVELYPAANPFGLMTLQRAVPVFDSDLNRSFPGHPEGLVPQRMADALVRHAAGAALVIDIHASNIFLREIPQVRINQSSAKTLVPLAEDMNLDVIWVHGASTVLEATFAHSMNSRRTPCLVVEMGVGMRVTPAFTEQLVTGILHVWRRLGVIDRTTELPVLTHRPALANDENVHYLNAETSGLFVPAIERLTTVTEGQKLGEIVSPFHGKVLSEVRSPVNGLLFTIREYPLVYEGSLIARLKANSPQKKGNVLMKASLILRMTTPTGPPFKMVYHDHGPKRESPALALVGGIHGNELNSIFVLGRLGGYLRSIAAGRERGQKLARRVIIIPAVNILGMHTRSRSWPFDKTDINRMFPGYAGGETTQRIAAAVLARTKPAAIRIDIHSSNLEFEELPQVRVHGPSAKEKITAVKIGLPAVVECPVNTVSQSTLLHAWKECLGQNFVIQGGVAGDLQLHHCNRLYKALVNFMFDLGIIKGSLPPVTTEVHQEPPKVHYFKQNHTVSLISEKAGLFISRATLGTWIEKGDPLGEIFDGYDGRVRSRVRAPVAGFLTGLRRQALLYQGDLLARIQSKQTVRGGADTYLIGQGQ